ncbi:hypothetical protein JAAARDRAFT_30978 [Jaapia argillacea MUCL 33604]|uniref:ATP-dependent (S)-NAD(P)H-hydrate dehydratase n=1 Tax=Jaapia argillacea MUCL 33604 TaxID=933084 RepID=A0A067Q389_9AGAM|nr:hypothetical protein JAAARDRAFT_30978 [Jaapia argillacea MUCL 33604]
MPVPRHIFDQIKKLIPPLDGSLHKGQSGRVGVLGGAMDYTGAPFFAAISAFRLGADLSHVICSPTAAGAIKSYAPDLIVHPMLSEDSSPEKVKPELTSLLSRLHVLIMGPGLGREPYMQSYARLALSLAKDQGMFVVLDADALWMVERDLGLIKGYRRAVLTPNVMEFKRLSEQVAIDPKTPSDKRASLVSQALGGVTVLQKGPKDIIATNTLSTSSSDHTPSKINQEEKEEEEVIEVDVMGGFKRCGGQGDVLSGTVGTWLAWGKCFESGAFGDGSIPPSRMPVLAATAGSIITRTTSKLAFRKQGRALMTEDLVPEIGKAFVEVFGEEAWSGSEGGKL